MTLWSINNYNYACPDASDTFNTFSRLLLTLLSLTTTRFGHSAWKLSGSQYSLRCYCSCNVSHFVAIVRVTFHTVQVPGRVTTSVDV